MDKATVRILVVDDDPAIQSLFRLALEQAGFNAEMAGTLAEAREKLKVRNYHLLLVDLALPDGSGHELVISAAEGDDGPSVIIVTGHPSVDSAAEGMQHGARNYLTKPITPEVLVEAVESVLAQDGLLIDSEEQFLAELGRRLKRARVDAELTMRALGERIGISQAQISQIEAGLSAPSLTTLFRLSRALRVPLSELMADS